MSTIEQRVQDYLRGPQQVREIIADMTEEQIDARPIPGKWSTRDVICHLADFEPVYADRIQRVVAEDNPPLPSGDPDHFVQRLAYDKRVLEEEIQLMEVTRIHVARILSNLSEADFQRTGEHSRDGQLTLTELLRRITNHVPHHIAFIREKRRALGLE